MLNHYLKSTNSFALDQQLNGHTQTPVVYVPNTLVDTLVNSKLSPSDLFYYEKLLPMTSINDRALLLAYNSGSISFQDILPLSTTTLLDIWKKTIKDPINNKVIDDVLLPLAMSINANDIVHALHDGRYNFHGAYNIMLTPESVIIVSLSNSFFENSKDRNMLRAFVSEVLQTLYSLNTIASISRYKIFQTYLSYL